MLEIFRSFLKDSLKDYLSSLFTLLKIFASIFLSLSISSHHTLLKIFTATSSLVIKTEKAAFNEYLIIILLSELFLTDLIFM